MSKPKEPRPWLLGVLALTLVGGFLRARGWSGFAVAHWDEGLVWDGARWFRSLGASGHYHPSHAPPLVALLMAGVCAVFGDSPRVALAVPWLFGTLAVPLAWLLAREALTRPAALLAAALVATSGFQVSYAQTLLTDAVYATLLLAALWTAARALRTERGPWFLASGLCVGALQATKYNGVIAALPLCVCALERVLRRAWPLGAAVRRVALCVAPALLVALANVAALRRLGVWDDFVAHYTGYVGVDTPGAADLVRVWRLALPVTLAAAAAAGLALSLLRPRVGASLLVALAALLYGLFLTRYAFYLRLLLPVATLACLLAAAGVERIARRRTPLAALALLALTLLEGTRLAPALTRAPSPGYAAAARALEAQPADAPLLLVTQDFVWLDLEREGRALHLPSARADAVLDAASEVLFVVDLHTFSREKPWDLRPLHAALAGRVPDVRVELFPGLDALQNNLTLDELERLEGDPELRERALTIRGWRIPSAELRGLVEVHAVLRD